MRRRIAITAMSHRMESHWRPPHAAVAVVRRASDVNGGGR